MEGCATKLLLLLQLMAMTTSPVQADSLDLALVDTLASHFALDRLVVFKKDVPAGIKERRRLLNTREKATKVAHSFGSVAAKDLKMSDALVLASDFSPEEVSSALRMSKNIAVGRTWLILVDEKAALDYSLNPSAINQRVFLVDTRSGDITEKYQTTKNGDVVDRTIAKISEDKRTIEDTVEQGFLERRSNFKGARFDVLVEEQFPYNVHYLDLAGKNLTETAVLKTPVHELSSSVLVGVFADIRRHLEKDLNFSTRLFNRQDHGWGRKINGSWKGMVENLIANDVDFAAASLTLTPEDR